MIWLSQCLFPSPGTFFFKEQGTVGVQLFCIWLSLMTLSVSDHKPYVYIYILHWHNHKTQSFFCFGIQTKKQKATLCLNQSWTFIDLFYCVLYIELDAKAEEQCADSIEEINRFSRGFSNFCPTFSKPNGTKTNPRRSMSGWPMSTQPWWCVWRISN